MERDGSVNLLDVLDELLQLPADQRHARVSDIGLSAEDTSRVMHWLAQQESADGFLDARPPLVADAMELLDDTASQSGNSGRAASGGADSEMELLLGLLDSSMATSNEETEATAGGEAAETNIGRYKLLRQIGQGGFGAVFLAEQQEPVRRNVALKVIKLGMDTRRV